MLEPADDFDEWESEEYEEPPDPLCPDCGEPIYDGCIDICKYHREEIENTPN